jgi:hypothetical protein
MPEECRDQERGAERAGDQYYRAMTTWLTGRKRSDGEKDRLFGLARIYDRALDLLVRCLERIQDRSNARRKLKQAAELRAHLQKDIKILASPGSGFTSQTDET